LYAASLRASALAVTCPHRPPLAAQWTAAPCSGTSPPAP